VKFEGFELFMVVLMKIQVFVTGWVVHMVWRIVVNSWMIPGLWGCSYYSPSEWQELFSQRHSHPRILESSVKLLTFGALEPG
jgi:hypothetical protein